MLNAEEPNIEQDGGNDVTGVAPPCGLVQGVAPPCGLVQGVAPPCGLVQGIAHKKSENTSADDHNSSSTQERGVEKSFPLANGHLEKLDGHLPEKRDGVVVQAETTPVAQDERLIADQNTSSENPPVVTDQVRAASDSDGEDLSDMEFADDDGQEEDARGFPRRRSGRLRNLPKHNFDEGETESPPARPAAMRRSWPRHRKNPAARHRQQWMKLWNAFRDSQNVTVSDQDMSSKSLNLLLERFFSQLAQRNGKDYSVFSIKQMWSTLNCYFSELEPPEGRKDLRLPDFDGARKCYETKMGRRAVRYRRASAPFERSSRRASDMRPDDTPGSASFSLPGAGYTVTNTTPRTGGGEFYLGSAASAGAMGGQFGLPAGAGEDSPFGFPAMHDDSPQFSMALAGPSAARGPGEDDTQRLRRHQVAMAEIFKGFNLQGANIHLHFH